MKINKAAIYWSVIWSLMLTTASSVMLWVTYKIGGVPFMVFCLFLQWTLVIYLFESEGKR